MPTAGHPPAVDGTKTSSDDADVTDCSDAALISRPALASIRRLGTTAWVVLELLTLEAADADGALVARTSARSIAEAVSVSKDTAAGALRRLADAGLVERRPQHRTSGRFGAGGYVLHLPAGLATAVRRSDETPPVPAPADRARPRPTRPPRPQRPDQLTLLNPPQDPQP